VPADDDGYAGLNLYILEQLKPSMVDPEFTEEMLMYRKDGGLYGVTADYPMFEAETLVPTSLAEQRLSYCTLGGNDTFCNETTRKDGRSRILSNAKEIKFKRSVYSNRQLNAVLLDFWFNHFNVSAKAGLSIWAHWLHEQTIQENMYGQFQDLVMATMQTPAMLEYLDLKRNKVNGKNENYARELMELHTVGASRSMAPNDITFGHNDIVQVADILTGITHYGMYDQYSYQPRFKSGDHVNGGKTVSIGSVDWRFGFGDSTDTTCVDSSGSTMTAYGEGGNAILETKVLVCLLSKHEKTIDFVGRKLINRFLGQSAILDTTGDTKTNLLATLKYTWDTNGGDLKKIIETILLSNDFRRSLYYQESKVKRPTLFSSGLARDTGRYNTVVKGKFANLVQDIAINGEDMFLSSPPTGYPEVSEPWIATSVMLNNFNSTYRMFFGSGNVVTDEEIRTELNLASSYIGETSEMDLINDVSRALGLSLSNTKKFSIETYLLAIPRSEDNSADNKIKHAVLAVMSTPDFIAQ
jgi:uncharacterized protein (DUF1800 family)